MKLLRLETSRLILRGYRDSDLNQLVPLIGAREVAATTLRIPHPYTAQDAAEFIARMREGAVERFAITFRADNRLRGGIGLEINPQHQHAELRYWIGVRFWRNGYATEAGEAMLRYGFEQLQLNRIFATHFAHNPASGKVLRKLGMQYEGCMRQHVRKWEQFVDLELCAILRQDWLTRVK